MSAVAYRRPTVTANGVVARSEYRVSGLLIAWRRSLDDEAFGNVADRALLCLDWLAREEPDWHGRVSDVACALMQSHRAMTPARFAELDGRVRECVGWLRSAAPVSLNLFRNGGS